MTDKKRMSLGVKIAIGLGVVMLIGGIKGAMEMYSTPSLVGKEVELYAPQLSFLDIAADRDALRLYNNAITAKTDAEAGTIYAGLVRDNKITPVSPHTRVRVLDIQLDAYQVQVLDGKQTGSIGWVDRMFIVEK